MLTEPSTVASGCQALARACRTDREAHSKFAGVLELLVAALHTFGGTDPVVMRSGCAALASLCRNSADGQAKAAAQGAFTALAACARAHPQHLGVACAAIESLCTGKGAAARRVQAVDAGWLPLLIDACGHLPTAQCGTSANDDTTERTRLAARSALRSITRDSLHLHQAALDAGSSRQWLM